MTETPGAEGWDPSKGPFGERVIAMNFVADAGKLMLESSTSVSEVLDRLRLFLPTVGLEGCSIDATISSLILSFWLPGQPLPITVMREISVGSPRLARLAGADKILDRLEAGTIELDRAVDQLQTLTSSQPTSWWATRVATVVSVVGWVVFVDGIDPLTVLVAMVATVFTFPIAGLVQRLRQDLDDVDIAILGCHRVRSVRRDDLAREGVNLWNDGVSQFTQEGNHVSVRTAADLAGRHAADDDVGGADHRLCQ